MAYAMITEWHVIFRLLLLRIYDLELAWSNQLLFCNFLHKKFGEFRIILKMSELSSWFKNLPIFTRHWFGLTIALSLVGRFAILSPKYLILDYHSIFESFHVMFYSKIFVQYSSVFLNSLFGFLFRYGDQHQHYFIIP